MKEKKNIILFSFTVSGSIRVPHGAESRIPTDTGDVPGGWEVRFGGDRLHQWDWSVDSRPEEIAV